MLLLEYSCTASLEGQYDVVVMKACEEDTLMGHLGVVLYEYLGEEVSFEELHAQVYVVCLYQQGLKEVVLCASSIVLSAVVMKACEEDTLMGHLGVVLYEYLGQEVSSGELYALVFVLPMKARVMCNQLPATMSFRLLLWKRMSRIRSSGTHEAVILNQHLGEKVSSRALHAFLCASKCMKGT